MPSIEPEALVAALGGPDNVSSVRSCVTRIHVRLSDAELVKKPLLKDYGISVVLETGDELQLIAGATAESIAAAVNDYLGDNS
ncbi:PTS transporter subunit EIIB [Corynebacterium mendelii]|uniref:PTS transporter subunit EIIB n=1 Tax=Corynebacterium mendelii TaxID=2765362 RepID=A0A939E0K3_9CORY|nr:PTS transporter subunit EIIB [Corynebacterium mendelii]MBN9643332.1 PTS transporter subunit EIIB [Corynebacterium mendelii]